jgi:hypothetical protein
MYGKPVATVDRTDHGTIIFFVCWQCKSDVWNLFWTHEASGIENGALDPFVLTQNLLFRRSVGQYKWIYGRRFDLDLLLQQRHDHLQHGCCCSREVAQHEHS